MHNNERYSKKHKMNSRPSIYVVSIRPPPPTPFYQSGSGCQVIIYSDHSLSASSSDDTSSSENMGTSPKPFFFFFFLADFSSSVSFLAFCYMYIERSIRSLPLLVCLRIADQIDARNRLARKRLAFAAPHELTPHLGSVQSMAWPLTMAVYRLQTRHERPSGHAIQWAI